MSSTIDEKFMQLAIEEAKMAKSTGEFPIGSIIVQNGKVVGKGRAEDKTTGDVTAHAELQALREACKYLGRKDLYDCVIYTTNEPCMMCAAGIFQAKIPEVKLGLSRDDLRHLLRPRNLGIDHLAKDSGYKITITRGILDKEILALFENFHK